MSMRGMRATQLCAWQHGCCCHRSAMAQRGESGFVVIDLAEEYALVGNRVDLVDDNGEMLV